MWIKTRVKKWKNKIFNAKNMKSLMFLVVKNYSVNNHMFIIDIENTRTRCKICSKLIIKRPQFFFYCWLWACLCLLASYLHFPCLHDLQKNWNLEYILKLALRWVTYQLPYAIRHNDARGWGDITNDVLKLLFRYCNLLYL